MEAARFLEASRWRLAKRWPPWGKPQTRPEVDEAEHRNRREDARTQNVWLFGG
jgi:hypothetical protein